MANRARRYEAALRDRQGVTDLARRLASDNIARVSEGPFKGLTYRSNMLHFVDAPVAKLVGSYEQELAWVFRAAIERETKTFIDIGSADGYFAVGMLVASPFTSTLAFELSAEARQLCREVAAINGTARRLQQRRRFTPSDLDAVAMTGALLLCDIEGAERDLFTPRLARRLRGAHVLVEVHEFARPGTGDHLARLFASSHDRVIIKPEPRDGTFVQLAAWSEADRVRALAEFRDAEMHWAYFVPHQATPQS